MRPAGFVLTGGQSSRMGRDKAMLPWRSRPLVESVAEAVRNAVGNVILIGEPKRYADLRLPIIEDLRPGLGPLGGLETALKSGFGELNLIVACDMPNLGVDLLTSLLKSAEENGAPCTYARDSNGRAHPLCAVYRTACLPFVEDAIAQRRLRMIDLVRNLEGVPLDWQGTIANVNTPSEWEFWRDDG
jgi:molybdopterin-guanine dinucleotide biosynthesis protein A